LLPPSRGRRILAGCIDFLLVLLAIWACFLFSKKAYHTAILFYLKVSLAVPQLLRWSVPLAFFVLAPLLLSISFLIFSASPGQIFLGLQERDSRTGEQVDVLQSLVLGLAMPLSVFLNFLPYWFALLNPERRNLTQLLVGTRTLVAGKMASQEYVPRPISGAHIWPYVCICLSLFVSGRNLAWLFTHSTVHKVGLVVGGSVADRELFFQKLLNPELELESKIASPEDCFERLRSALKNRDKLALYELLTLASQALLKINKVTDPFEDLPRDIQFVRLEGLQTDDVVKIFYREVEGGHANSKESFMTFSKEEGSWKINLIAFLAQQKRAR